MQSSTIEGIDVFAEKFIHFFKKISTQKYDALNHRLDYFDKDYAEFKQNVVDTEWELEEFVGNSLEKMTDVDNVLRLLKRFALQLFLAVLLSFFVFQVWKAKFGMSAFGREVSGSDWDVSRRNWKAARPV